MIFSPLEPLFYEPINQMMISLAADDLQQLREKWDDEAAEAAVTHGGPRAGYIEYMREKLLG